jgi:hypothetical protein
VGLIVKKEGARTTGIHSRSRDCRQRCADPLGRLGVCGPVCGLDADFPEGDTSGSEKADAALERLADAGERVATPDEGVAISCNRLGKALGVAMPVAEFASAADPARTLGAGRELAEKHGLASTPEAGE